MRLKLKISLLLALILPAAAFAASPGAAIQFGGSDGFLSVTDNGALNVFPATVTAWFRSTNSGAALMGIVGKYINATANGYFLTIQNGKLRGYYSASSVAARMDVTTSRTVTDGFWHHAAMVVTASGGTLYLDGQVVGSSGAVAGPPTSGAPFLIGAYWQAPYVFQGTLDEVTVWNRALSSGEINNVKHRRLNGDEDGLVGLWHLDEGMGTTTADSTKNGNDATLVDNPVWVNSTAPVVLNQVAGEALNFAGNGDYVSVDDSPELDSFPLTVTAWVKTTRNSPSGDGIVTKYVDASYNGYAMFLANGHVRGWYFKDATDYVWDQNLGLDGGFIADGSWHHLAMTVDGSGGRIYVDGSQTAYMAWHNMAGAASTMTPLEIGRYWNYPNTWQGTIDEVSVWNTALSAAQVAAYEHVPLSGTETGLIGLWHLNDGTGPTATDSTQRGHDGTLQNAPTWTGSTASLGDGTSVIHTTLGTLQWAKTYAVKTVPGQQGFGGSATYWVRRLDDFNGPVGSSVVNVILQSELMDAAQAPEALVTNLLTNTVTVFAYQAAAPQLSAGGYTGTASVNVQPDPSVQLDSVNDSFQFGVSESFSTGGGAAQFADNEWSAIAPLMHFDGHLLFGPVDTIFSLLSGTPPRGAVSGAGIATSLNVLRGYVSGKPDHLYGSGAAIAATLQSNGDAVSGGTVTIVAPTPDTDVINTISYTRTNETLGPSGMTAYLSVNLPLGFSLGVSLTNRLTIPFAPCGTFHLDGNLAPTNATIAIAGPIYGVEETLPYWFVASGMTWQVAAGQLVCAPTSGQFARQAEDDALLGQQSKLTLPNLANRISNDGYLRNAVPLGSSLVITADANGAAQITTQLALNPPDFRPHFPYTTNTPGAQIPVAQGQLSLVSNLVDPSSVLTLTGPVPVFYGRDCLLPGCTAGQAGAAQLAFTATTGQLNFTPDGGLLAYGSVPSATLQWGYAGGANFAQQAGPVTDGAFCVAGTFLRNDQSALAAGQLPSVILLSGFGDASNPGYLERPGQGNYPAGAANYAGLNFRSPSVGQSYLGQHDTGTYSLDPVCKYYARYGGLSGIQQAQAGSFPRTLTLYGYTFTFTDYGLSYLDGQNAESVTVGAVSFQTLPSGFTQAFDRMMVTCRGDLSSASVPANSPVDHLKYWNVDLTPQSVQFNPTNNDTCGTSPRYLVLGAEMTLPFVMQPLHASIGFHPDGNLVTFADNVQNVDSRFAVPGQLALQGPGSTTFLFSTASEAYFNNYRTPGASALQTGFFNLVGKVRAPFFEDIKVHFHVTPTSKTSATIDVMGGWAAANSGGADQGWSVGGQNYFNTAKFDANADGWPAGVAIGDYRNSSTEQYHPRAQRDWIEVAKFDYPLEWDALSHAFKGFQTTSAKLPVIDVDSRLHELAPGKIDLDFAQDIKLQLPRIKVLDVVNDALNGNNGPLVSVSNAIRSTLGQAFDATGLNELQTALREDANGFFDPILGSLVDNLMPQIYSQLSVIPQGNPQVFLQQVYAAMSSPAGPLAAGITTLNNVTNQAGSILLTVDKTLQDTLDTAGLIDRILMKDPNTGERQAITKIVEKLVDDQSGALNFVGGLADSQINPLIADADPTLTEIQLDIEDATNQLAQVKEQIDDAAGDFNQALGSVISDGNSVNTFLKTSAQNVTNYLASVLTQSGDLFTVNQAATQQAIKKEIVNAFLSSALTGNYQMVFRQFLGDNNALLDEVMNAMFAQINSTIRDALENQILGAQDGVFQNLKGSGLLSGQMFSAKIRGAPVFNGDSLRSIHLDSAMELDVPDKMAFTAYMDIKELDSQSAPVDCVPAGSPAAEVTLGAKNVKLDWAGVAAGGGEGLTLSLEARWTLQNASVIGVGGTLIIGGGPSFEGCQLKELGATLAIGETENYFAAKADATIPVLGIPVEVQAGVFAGQACSLDPLKFVDPEVEQVLITNPQKFSGVYVEYGGGFSLSDLLGLGDAGCVLSADASITTAYYFLGGPALGTIGGRQKMAVDISLLCLLSGHADWAEFLALDTSGQLTVGGSANVCGSVGPCPFCVSGCKGVTVKGIVSTHGIDYHVDY